MEKVRLQLLKDWKNLKKGDVVSVPAGILPQRMIENKTAKHYTPKKVYSSKKSKKDMKNGD